MMKRANSVIISANFRQSLSSNRLVNDISFDEFHRVLIIKAIIWRFAVNEIVILLTQHGIKTLMNIFLERFYRE